MKRVDKEIWLKPQDQATSTIWEFNSEMFDLVFNYYSISRIDLIAIVVVDDMNSREEMRIKNE